MTDCLCLLFFFCQATRSIHVLHDEFRGGRSHECDLELRYPQLPCSWQRSAWRVESFGERLASGIQSESCAASLARHECQEPVHVEKDVPGDANVFALFPRASERRVLPIVGVCKTSSHLHIFSSSHLLILTSSPIHIFSSSHLLIFTSSHLHIFSSSHLLIFTSSHLLILRSSHLLIFTSSHLLVICSSSHLHIFTSSHLRIFSSLYTSSHLHIFSSSHLHIFSSAHLHIFTSSHLHICSSDIFPHLLIFTSSHPHIFTSSHLHILSSCPLLLFYFSLVGAGQCQRDGTKRNPFARNEVRSPKTAR